MKTVEELEARLEVAMRELAFRTRERDVAQDSAYMFESDWKDACRERDEARAALADATTEWKSRRCECAADDFCKIAQERNEARAEVERWRTSYEAASAHTVDVRAMLDQVRKELYEARCEVERLMHQLADQTNETTRVRLEAKREGEDAYRRGAEAMREACMDWCKSWENNGKAIAAALADVWIGDEDE
ncbi:MAG: hypothetical protein EBR82_14975 [Caulobacteraceae bacterium]|nr:hypothetical protein [Caulobacteraceae bacterium]